MSARKVKNPAKKVQISEKTIKALKPDPKGQGGQEIADTIAPNLRIRPNKGGHSYVYYGRFGGVPTRRTIGQVGRMGLADARKKAREWAEAAALGIDPAAEARKAREAEAGRTTFASAMTDYLKRHVAKTRKARDSEREIRKELMSRWADWALADVTRKDVVKMVDELLDRGAEHQARNMLGHCRTFYNWCIGRGIYGIEASPCDRLKPKTLIGEKRGRQRVLDDAELRAFWAATGRMGYPYGPAFRLLLLTGCRKSEIGAASWREIDLEKQLLVVPPERFKSDATHVLPLSADALAIIADLPRWKEGNFVFSTRGGVIPIDGWSKAKARLDQLVSEELGREVEPFVSHDLRRTVRTRLSSLVPSEIAERVIGHTLPSMHKVYDQHSYLDEKRHALELWAAKLRSIITPPPDNVLQMPTKKKARRARA